MLQAISARADRQKTSFAHWYIDGGPVAQGASDGITSLSYSALDPVRSNLQKQMQKAYESGMGAEAMRSLLARLRPEEIGFDASGDPVLNRFATSLLTEGSGTQVFSTTFVQWAARETLRRAQPVTLLVRFAARQRERPMNELLKEIQRKPELDPQGSLVDADMGAYYTWINQQRLTGADQSRFLAWFEDHEEAVAIGPGFEAGKASSAPVAMESLLAKLT